MSQVKSNLIRIIHTAPNYHRYKLGVQQNYVLEEQDLQQLRLFIYEKSPLILYQFPYLLSVKPFSENSEIQSHQFKFMLSRGVYVTIKVQLVASYDQKSAIQNTEQFGQLISLSIMRNTEFLYSKHLNACFNPFEQLSISNQESQIPGFTLQMNYQKIQNSSFSKLTGVSIVPVRLVIKKSEQISMHNSQKVLLDISKGRFYNKDEIVRVDKTKNKLHFRNGQILQKGFVKLTVLKNYIGFALTQKLSNFLMRMKQTSKNLLENWNMKFDSRFLDLPSSFVQVGRVQFRKAQQNNQKPLSDLIFGVARNTYNHYFRNFYSNVSFDAIVDNQIIFFVPDYLNYPQGNAFIDNVNATIKRMELRNKTLNIVHQQMTSHQEIIQMLKKEGKPMTNTQTNPCLHTFIVKKQTLSNERDLLVAENFRKIKQFMINQGYLFHVLELDQFQDQIDIKAVRFLSINYAKVRMSPWKIKDIPFGQKPAVAISLNVQPVIYQNQQQFSVAMVCTMNLFFNKFTCINVKCKPNQINDIIFFCLKQCLLKFSTAHKIFPSRVFIFRNGFGSSQGQIHSQYKFLRESLTRFYQQKKYAKMNTITYIGLSKRHPLRVYSQIDMNLVNPDTVKKVQLLCILQHQGQNYIQLEAQEAIMKVIVIQKEQDPSFLPKIMQLTCKLIYGSVGNQFGKGLGFIQLAARLNQYKQFNLDGWKNMLNQGFLTFL